MLHKIALTALAAFAIGCGGSGSGGYGTGPTPPPPPNPSTVDATASLAFSPATITVAAGTSVNFAFASVGHNVYFDAMPGVPANIAGTNANTTVSRVFSTKGTFTYTCHIHPGMHGTVVVN